MYDCITNDRSAYLEKQKQKQKQKQTKKKKKKKKKKNRQKWSVFYLQKCFDTAYYIIQ